MSDWEDLCDSMGWTNDEHATDKLIDYINHHNEEERYSKEEENYLLETGYKTVKEWSEIGRSVKNGVPGTYLRYAKIMVFSESDTVEIGLNSHHNSLSNKLHFQTFEKAITWAKSNPGKVITRSPTGNGYIEK